MANLPEEADNEKYTVTSDENKSNDTEITKNNQTKNNHDKNTPVNFDDALTQTKFGKFNYFLIIISGGILTAVLMETLGISFILSVSQCDLKITTEYKGLLSAVGYAGIISSSYLWGFLADTAGRRKVILPTLFVAFVCSVLSSLTNNFWLFIVLRYFNGFFLAGSSATVYAYLGEFHNLKNRSRVIMFASVIFGIFSVLLPVIAYLVINREWQFDIPLIGVTYKPWRFFLVVCSLPSLFCAISIMYIPESPKFVLSQGDQKETLRILEIMNRVNNGKKAKPLEIHTIIEDSDIQYKNENKNNTTNDDGNDDNVRDIHKNINKIDNNSIGDGRNSVETTNETTEVFTKDPWAIFKAMWRQTIPLFLPPYLTKTLLVGVIQFGIYVGAVGIYMWFPDILNRSVEYMTLNPSEEGLSLCNVIYRTRLNITAIASTEGPPNEMICTTKLDLAAYQYTFVLEILYAAGFAFIGLIINPIGKLPIIATILIGCGVCGVLIVFVTSPMVGIYFYLILLLCGLAITVMNAVTIDLYPTHLRAMAVCISLMIGRLGSVVGANIAGLLLDYHCDAMFSTAGVLSIACGILAFFIPNIRQKPIYKNSSPEKSTTSIT